MYSKNTSTPTISPDDLDLIEEMVALPAERKTLAMGFILGMKSADTVAVARSPAERPSV